MIGSPSSASDSTGRRRRSTSQVYRIDHYLLFQLLAVTTMEPPALFLAEPVRDEPFYLRTGKRLPSRVTEIAIRFRRAGLALFRETPVECMQPNCRGKLGTG